MTTETLKEADRYLLNNGFKLGPEVELDNQYQASYDLGKSKKDFDITITLFDYGDGHWTYTLVGCSEKFTIKSQEIIKGLSLLPGFERHRI
jgi:hypothetical protein